jgi:hypothetical protein
MQLAFQQLSTNKSSQSLKLEFSLVKSSFHCIMMVDTQQCNTIARMNVMNLTIRSVKTIGVAAQGNLPCTTIS